MVVSSTTAARQRDQAQQVLQTSPGVQDSTSSWKRITSGVFWHEDLLMWIYQEVPGGWVPPTGDGFWHKSGSAPAQNRGRGIEEGGKPKSVILGIFGCLFGRV